MRVRVARHIIPRHQPQPYPYHHRSPARQRIPSLKRRQTRISAAYSCDLLNRPSMFFCGNTTESKLLRALLTKRNECSSETVYTTAHTEFGHCANEQYRYLSKHKPSAAGHDADEPEPPYYIILTTYMSYLLLIILGHLRDFFGKRFYPHKYKHLMPHKVRICQQYLLMT